jgi:hypothetical protein
MKMQPAFFITILIVLLSMIVLESDVMRSQPHQAVTTQRH